MNFNKKFKNDFKKIAFEKKGEFISELSKVFDSEPDHFARILFTYYHFFYPKYYFDKKEALLELSAWFERGSLFIYDLEERFQGGYKKIGGMKRPLVNDGDEEQLEIALQNMKRFQKYIKDKYWKSEKRQSKFKELSNFSMFIKREPLTQREKILNNRLFNLGGVNKYFHDLMELNYPFLKYQSKISDKRFMRFAKKINRDIFIGINFDLAFVNREMKMGFLELPKFHFEIFSDKLKKSISPKNYIKNSEKFPIVLIDLYYLLAEKQDRLADFYRNDFIKDEEIIKRETFFYMESISFILKFYFDFIKQVLQEIEHLDSPKKK